MFIEVIFFKGKSFPNFFPITDPYLSMQECFIRISMKCMRSKVKVKGL